MNKKILNLIKILFIFLFLNLNHTFAATNTWEFDLSTDYTYSNSPSFTLSGSIANLNKTSLTHAGVITNGTNYNGAYDVVVEGNYAYMTSYLGNRVNILDISNPSSPTLVGSILDNGGTIRLAGASSLVKDGNYLYVTSYLGNAVQIINVTNPAAPVAAGQFFNATTMAGARGIEKAGNYIYVAVFTYDALQVIDVTNPASPSIIGTYRQTTNMNGASEVKISGNYAYVSAYNRDALSIINISNPASPSYITQIRDGTNLNGARDVAVSGNYAYVSAYLNNSVRVIDISNPALPTAVTNISGGSYSISGPRDLDIDNNKLFIAGYTSNAVNVADISNPTAPVYLTKIIHNAANPLLQGAGGLFRLGDFIYTASYTSDALEILRYTYDTTSPFLQPVNNFNYGVANSIVSFSQTLGAGNQGTITYQISKNNGTTWYYFNGTSWVTTTGGVAQSSTIAQINTNIASFNALAGGTGLFTYKAFFTSNGTQKVELDTIDVVASDPPSPAGVSTNLSIWLKANKGTSTTTDGSALTTWNDQSGNGFNAGGGVSPTYMNSATNNLNYNPIVNFNGTTQYLQNLANGGNSTSYFMVVVPNSTVDGTLTGQVPYAFDCLSGVLSSGTCGLSFAGLTLGAFTVALNDEVLTHAIGSSTNWRSAQTGIASYESSKPMLLMANENATANGTDIYEKGIKVDNTTTNTYQTLATADFSLGKTLDAANQFFYNGKIAEVINYSGRVSDTDRNKIESYLSLKYGITLNNGTQNYVASNGSTLMWSTSVAGTYINSIFGIGRDDLSELGQVKSKSSNNDGIITLEAIGEGTNLVNSFVNMSDKEFMSVSDNNLGNTWTNIGAPATYNILTRKWKVQETGDVGTVNLDFDVANTNFDVPVPSSGVNYYFVYDSNINGSLSDETPQLMTNMGGNIWRISGVNPSHNQIFTLASLAGSNNIPTNISLSSSSINENVAANSTVGTLSTTDADLLDTHTYTFVTGAGDTDNASFSIVGNTLRITESPDYELKNSYDIRINTNDGNGGNLQKAFTISINDLGEVISSLLDFEQASNKYTVTSGNWSRVTTDKFEGSYSIQSNNGGAINSQSCFQVNHTFSATGTLDFKYRVSSQAGADFLRFYIDDIEQQFWSGTVAWSTYNDNAISAGLHSYKWCYIKDGATNTGLDSAFIDYITYQNTNVDITPPIISSINFASGALLPGGNHTISINYSDAQSGINTSSDIITLSKWNGTVWGADISASGLNLGSKIVNSTSATYTTNNLAYGKYRYTFQISDNNGNNSSTGAVFYIDRPEIVVSTGSYLSTVGPTLPTEEIIVTIKTVGAAYKLEFLKDTTLNDGYGNIIIDWNGTSGVGYDKTPYSGPRKNIPSNPVLGTGALNINTNGNLNTYTYNIKVGNIVNVEQAAGNYEMDVSFRGIFNY
ncbi:MAG: hypothetical protein PHH98_01275 [Candidatus Gracilibacteria bacterium]|nr:hypothetical protein [Candidatus Gracilibacteria bacterium]